jgi:hypothetical protein
MVETYEWNTAENNLAETVHTNKGPSWSLVTQKIRGRKSGFLHLCIMDELTATT